MKKDKKKDWIQYNGVWRIKRIGRDGKCFIKLGGRKIEVPCIDRLC